MRPRANFSFESLESRLPLAGNVTTSLQGGILTLTGDANTNAVDVRLVENNQVAVMGLDAANLPTSIDNVANGTKLFANVTQLVVLLDNGDDLLRVNNLSLTTLRVEAGMGSDQVLIGAPDGTFLGGLGMASDGSVSVTNTLRVDLGAGADDLVRLQRVFGAAAWDIDAASDIARVRVYETGSGGVDVQTTVGNDILEIYNHAPTGLINIQTGGGDDQLRMNESALSSLMVNAGTGSDQVLIGAPAGVFLGGVGNVSDGSIGISGTLNIDLGTGADDLVRLQRVFGAGDWVINAASGIARVRVYDSACDSLNAQLGAGNDILQIYNHTATAEINIQTNAGNDQLQLVNCSLQQQTFLQGGDGSDLFGMDVNQYGGLVFADTGAGNDFLLFSRSVAAGEVLLGTGAGIDTLLVGRYYDTATTLANGGSSAQIMRLDTGDQADNVQIATNSVEELFAEFGDGDDSVLLHYNYIRNTGMLDGGSGRDPLTVLALNNLRYLNFTSVGGINVISSFTGGGLLAFNQ